MDGLKQVSEWLEQHKNQKLSISKHEDGDVDQVELTFDRVGISQLERHDPEDYVAPHNMFIYGRGMMRTASGQVPLPLDRFEIPITGQWDVSYDADGVTISTARGVYQIRESN